MTDSRSKKRNAACALALLLALFSLLSIAGGVYWWFYRGFTWDLGLFEISIHQWDKSWVNAMVAWLAAALIRPRPFYPRSWGRIFDIDAQTHSPVQAWALFGIVPGAAVGFMVARSYLYMFPTLGHALALTSAFALVSSAVHGVYAKGIDSLPLLIYRDSADDYRAGLRGGIYLLLLMALVRWPLREWEGRFFDPLWPLFVGSVIGCSAVLALALPGRFKNNWLTRGRATAFLASGLAMASVVSLISFRLDDRIPEHRVFVITLDATRADRLSCYGYERKTSPFIDSIAKNGVRFEQAICPMGTTDPSHVSMFTGAYPRTHGLVDVAAPITGAVVSLPERLRERGFATAAITSRARLLPGATLNLPGFDYENGPVRSRHLPQISAPHTFRRAANWLVHHRGENSFMWIHFFDPHDPYIPHPDFPVAYTDTDEPCKPDRWLDENNAPEPSEVQRCRDLYDGEIVYTDYWVKRTVEWIDNLEPQSSRPSLIVLIADHGEALGEYIDRDFHFGFGHEGLIHNSVAHIPFIIYQPGVAPENMVINEIVEIVDLAPTLMDYLFDSQDFPAQGISLRPLMEGTGHGDGEAFMQRWLSDIYEIKPHPGEPRYAVFKNGYKLMITPGKDRKLYRFPEDMEEETDLTLIMPDMAADLEASLNDWLERTPYAAPADVDRSERDDPLIDLGYINPGGKKKPKNKNQSAQ